MDWDDAMKVGNGFNYGGVTGWRLPNIEELKTIMIKGKAGYASAFFSRPESDTWGSYWSSSPVANDSSYAWFVGFYGRSGGNGAKTNNYYVRLVRSSQ